LRVLVCIKQILDPEIPPRNFRVDRTSKQVIPGDAAWVLNPFDANALELALQLKDRQKDCSVTALTLGGEACGKVLRHALAMGCDEALWLKDPFFEGLDSWATAKVIAKGIQKRGPLDLVLCGRQAGDWDMGQVGALIAEELSLPFVSLVSKAEVHDGKIRWQREIDRGFEIVETLLPALATVTSSSSNQPRYPTAKGIVLAGRKKIAVFSAQDLGMVERLAPRVAVEDLWVPNYERQMEVIEGEDGTAKALNLVRTLTAMKVFR